MSTYFHVPLASGRRGIARVFVKPDGSDELQMLYRQENGTVVWGNRYPGKPWMLADLDREAANDFCNTANKRWTEQAAKMAAEQGSK
jgi:hypothetical protein